jgi:hypothetical protein
MYESRGQFGSSDKPRVVPWAQLVISKWTGFSRITAAVLLPRRLLVQGLPPSRGRPFSMAAREWDQHAAAVASASNAPMVRFSSQISN